MAQSLRRNPLLRVTPDLDADGESSALRTVDPIEAKSFRTSTGVLRILDGVDTWTPREDVEQRVVDQLGVSDEEATHVVDELQEKNLLVPENERTSFLTAEAENWEADGWRDALLYYTHVRGYPFVDDVIDQTDYETTSEITADRMRQYSEENPKPPIYKTYEDAEVVDLPSPDESRSFDVADAMHAPLVATGDEAGSRLDSRHLSSILYHAMGETTQISTRHQGRLLRKPVPSGGARHPVEGYVAVSDVEDVPSGVYHYSVEKHALEKVAGPNEVERVERAVADSASGTPAVVVLYTAKVERSMWRYREPRTYRVLYHDAGHVVETVRLFARSYEFDAYTGFRFDDERLHECLGVDVEEEPLLAFTTIR